MKNNWLSIPLLVSALLTVQSVSAGHDYSAKGKPGFYDYAKVVAVEPVVKYVRVSTPHRECWEEEVPGYHAGYKSVTPMIVGGIIGGAIGNRVVRGHKDLGIAAGALLGGSIARDIHSNHRQRYATYTTTRTRCEQIANYHEEERIDGYLVTYRYKGEVFTTRTNRDPGDRLKVRVSVKPAY